MSGADDATAALRAAASMAGINAAIYQAQGAQTAMREADDLLHVMSATVGVILAAESIEAAAAEAKATARQALAQAMELGATQIDTGSHTVSLVSGRRIVVITDPSLIPSELMVQPPAAPDKTEIARRLRDGATVPGAALSNGGASTVSIRSKK